MVNIFVTSKKNLVFFQNPLASCFTSVKNAKYITDFNYKNLNKTTFFDINKYDILLFISKASLLKLIFKSILHDSTFFEDGNKYNIGPNHKK